MAETPQEIKKQEGIIDAAVSDKYMQETDAKSVKDATDALKKIKDDPKQKGERKKSAEKILEDHKNPIKESIIQYLSKQDVTLPNGKIMKIDNITKLANIQQIEAYENIIKWINNPDDKALQKISWDLSQRKENINKTKEATEVKEKDIQLFNLLSADPTKDNAQKLFGDSGDEYKAARESLFTQTEWNNLKIKTDNINEKTNLDATKMEKNFQELIKIAAGINGKEVKDFKINIYTSNGKDAYNEWTKYIQVSYKIENEEKTTKNITKDIMFGKSTDIIHQARADHMTDTDIATFQTAFETSTKDGITTIDQRWAHLAFKKLIDAKLLKTPDLLDKWLLKEINEFYTKKEWNDNENKENQYYSIITDIVAKEAKWGNVILLKKFLESVNSENLKYLGKDKATQIANYNKLVDVIQSPEFKKNINDPVNQEIYSKVLALQTQLGNPKWRKEALNSGVDWFFQAYGKHIVGILERFGGKWCVKKFFHALGMDAFYEKNLKSIEDNINKIYKEKFNLSADQKKWIDDIIWTKDAPKFDNKELFELSKAKEKINAFWKDKDKQKTFTDQLKTWWEKKEGYIKLLDPTLVHYLITKDFTDNKSLDSKDDGKPLNVNDFVVKDATTNEWKINENLSKDDGNQNKLIARLFADQTTRDTIEWANMKIEWVKTSRDGAKLEYSRSDLSETPSSAERKQYSIQSDQDIARFLTAYAFAGSKTLDYVITESGQSHEVKETDPKKINYTIKGTDNKGANFRDEKWWFASTTTIPENSDVEGVPDTDGKEIIKKWSDIWLSDKTDLKDKEFIRVKYWWTEWYIAKEYLEKKNT